jgi:hypothetical protein
MNGPYDVIDIGKRLKVEYGPFIEVRANVTADDQGNPVNFDDCHDLTGWEYVDVYIKVSGTNPSWDITPVFGQDESSFDFYDGQSITVLKDEIRRVQVLGVSCLYF